MDNPKDEYCRKMRQAWEDDRIIYERENRGGCIVAFFIVFTLLLVAVEAIIIACHR